MYFAVMPNIYYDFLDKDGKPSLKILKDITTNVRFLTKELENYTMYDYYDILDDETPEIISTKVYGSPKYHWIIMIVNDMYDYRNDFPLNANTLTINTGAGQFQLSELVKFLVVLLQYKV